jgi:hypothetical protein
MWKNSCIKPSLVFPSLILHHPFLIKKKPSSKTYDSLISSSALVEHAFTKQTTTLPPTCNITHYEALTWCLTLMIKWFFPIASLHLRHILDTHINAHHYIKPLKHLMHIIYFYFLPFFLRTLLNIRDKH